ncbi:SLC5A7 [Lepeophtheirus salmonis]|uniref:SLC5A7 n=1 Tax=Lepeophtheirus salmonis TaxID=72036 RepID=A0A7R8CKC0_LEPSM|nr:SLC5A7 [Lepeophtheirus salmonis]CAF2818995.1 SLC5A7 [Lepeophtheirus salmonis]
MDYEQTSIVLKFEIEVISLKIAHSNPRSTIHFESIRGQFVLNLKLFIKTVIVESLKDIPFQGINKSHINLSGKYADNNTLKNLKHLVEGWEDYYSYQPYAERYFGSAGILAALGATLAIVINMDLSMAVIMSAFIAMFYTWFGGLYAVAYTDVVQLGLIAIGLVACIPFAWNNEAVNPMTYESQDWIGSIPDGQGWYYMDYMLLLTFGGIPWQVYFQRVLSSKSANGAETLSYIAAIGCIIMAIPPILIGAIAKNTNWNETDFTGILPLQPEDHRMILPMVIQFLTPSFVSFFGLGAVAAAVMSSADSSVLSASSMFARNVYKLIFRQRATDSEIMWVMRISIFIVGALATYMALSIPTIYGLWAMCSDLVYVILFPQLFIVVHFKSLCNTYGSLCAYMIGMMIRLSGGEPLLKLPALIHYPLFDQNSEIQYFPFRTMAMLVSVMTLLGVSTLTKFLFEKGHLSTRWDIFNVTSLSPPDQGVAMSSIDTKVFSDEAPSGSGLINIDNSLPIRKPDPPLREIRRQISFTGGSGIGSIKKKLNTQASIESNKTGAYIEENIVSDIDDKKIIRKESFKSIKKKEIKEIKYNLREEVKEVKAELIEKAKNIPDGHRGSIAVVIEKPSYKPPSNNKQNFKFVEID